MRLNHYEQNVVSSGISGKKVTISSNAKTFGIFFDKIYNDIKLAIVREMLTNGFDAQCEAGNPDTPMTITMPSMYDDSRIIFRDYGVGMTPQLIDEIYSNMMVSSKDDSDDAVGGWGLGSKTPYGYTKQYTVRSFIDGTVYSYLMFINKDGEPEIAPISEEFTTEPNGCEVAFTVERTDYKAFETAIRTVTPWFETVPTIVGRFDPPLEQHEFTEIFPNLWRTSGKVSGDGELYVRQGCVAYPLDLSKIKDSMKPSERMEYGKIAALTSSMDLSKVFLNVPVGSCDVTASRDSLYYNDKTCDYLTKLLLKLYDTVKEDMESKLKGVKTYYEACHARFSVNCPLFGEYHTHRVPPIVDSVFDNYTFNGRETIKQTTFANVEYKVDQAAGVGGYKEVYPGVKFCKVDTLKQSKRITMPSTAKSYMVYYSSPLVVVYDVMDTKTNKYTRKHAERLGLYVSNLRKTNSGTQVLYVKINTTDMTGFQTFLNELGSPPTVSMKDLDVPVTEKVGGAPQKRDVRRITSSRHPATNQRLVNESMFASILASGNFMYIYTSFSQPEGYDASWRDINDMVKALDTIEDIPVIYVPKTRSKELNPHIKDKNDYVEYLRDALVKSLDLKEYARIKKIADMTFSYVQWPVLNYLDTTFGIDEPDSVLNAISMVRETMELYCQRNVLEAQRIKEEIRLDQVMKVVDKEQADEIRRSLELFEKTTTVPLSLSDLDRRTTLIERQYPLLFLNAGGRYPRLTEAAERALREILAD